MELKRTGSDYRGPCPFHGGTHRNFAVIPKKGRYYCFVCHESGRRLLLADEAVRHGLSDRGAGGGAPRRDRDPRARRDAQGPTRWSRCSSAVAVAQDWFTRQLLESPEASDARAYLEGREIPLDTAGEHGLGYAPPGQRLPRRR